MMPLPKLKQPLFECEIPTLGRKIKFRPMLVKEEKILLIAKQSGELADKIRAVYQVVNNCIADPTVKTDMLALCDIEYVFTKIRANSVSNIVKLSYMDDEDKQQYDFDVDLNEVKTTEISRANKFRIGTDIDLTLRFPPITLYTNSEFFSLDDAQTFQMVMERCMDRIYEGDKIYKCGETSKEELTDFIDSLPSKVYTDIQAFFASTPTIYHEIKYTNSKGTERSIKLTSLDDFFMYG